MYDYGHCRDCGRPLALVAHHPPEMLCHPCWMLAKAPRPPCPDGCTPVDVPPAFGHVAPCDRCPHVRCAVCGTWAEAVSPAELAEAWGAMLAATPVEGQTSWL